MYDLIIIGAGPAGLTASIYASCFKLNHLVIGKVLGGQVSLAPDILNYPGFQEIVGTELTDKMVNQVKSLGGEIVIDGAVSVTRNDQDFVVTCESGKKFETRSVILATGVERRKLNVPGETEYTGKGLQYCAKCEGHDYDNKIVAVVGGANAAAQTAAQLAHAATKVYIICRGAELRCDEIWLNHIKEHPQIEVIYKSQVAQILGDGKKVTGIKIKSGDQTVTQGESVKEIPIDILYIEIGGVPGSAIVASLEVKVDAGGFIEVDNNMATNVAGIFAAGDMTSHKYSIEQISTAVGLGARATQSVFSYLKQQKAPNLWGSSQIKRAG